MGAEYYALKNDHPSPLRPLLVTSEDFSALDQPPFRIPTSNPPQLDFFIEGIHCTACIWILERLPEMSNEILSARLDFGRALLRVILNENGKFETVARLLYGLGYRPHPVLTEAEAAEKLVRADRKTLMRMGVSAFAAMNVMVYSVSLYTGVDGGYGTLFRWLSILISIPALTYGAWPFYQNAWTALRSRRISIDLPISLAFIGGFFESLRQTLLGSNLLYLDSLTSLVFLMLASRYTLSRIERAEVSQSGILQALLPQRSVLLTASTDGNLTESEVSSRELLVGNHIVLRSGASSPADCRLIEGLISVDQSFLTGESRPLDLKTGDFVLAGSRIVGGTAVADVEKIGNDTTLGRIQQRLETTSPRLNRRTEKSDRWATIYLASVLGFSGLLIALYGRSDLSEAIRRSLSLMIIACPCALALATPLALAQAHRLASGFGILIRNPDLFDRLLDVKHIAFDKTGTLTEGAAEVKNIQWNDKMSIDRDTQASILYSLELQSNHPFGRAITKHLENREGVHPVLMSDVNELPGVGVSGIFDRKTYEVRQSKLLSETIRDFSEIDFLQEGRLLATLQLTDPLRKEAEFAVQILRAQGYSMEVLSGDQTEVVASVSNRLGMSEYKGRLSPEAKRVKIIDNGKATVMIGDGVNDALALNSAEIGIAMSRGNGASVESTLASAEVAFLRPDLMGVPRLFDIAKRYRRTLRLNALFSVGYNLIGASLAVSGLVHPLVAAVAMPASALTVTLSTAYGLRKNGGKQS